MCLQPLGSVLLEESTMNSIATSISRLRSTSRSAWVERPRQFISLAKARVMALSLFTTGPDSTHNVLAPAFGVLIVFLVLVGSLAIMANLNENTMAYGEMMNLQMQR
jgi:heme O synthase-like polyprenyltransferase